MRKIIAATAIGGALLAGSLAGIGSANATGAVIGDEGDMDAYNFRDELRYSGLFHEDVQNATELGPRMCRQRIAGWSSRELERDLMYGEGDYTSEQAVAIVRGAEWHFCPAYGKDR